MMRSDHDPITLFEKAAALWPDRPALVCAGRTMTYHELDEWSDRVAHKLRTEDHIGRVAFVATKTPASYALILGILKSGGSYLPLSPDDPSGRHRIMLQQAGVCHVRSLSEDPVQAEHMIATPVHEDMAPRPISDRHSDEAYVLFTSGSTGRPKGVSVSRANMAAYLGHQITRGQFNEHDRFTQFFALTFDLSVHDMFVSWAFGGSLHVPEPHAALNAAKFVRDHGITSWFSVPSVVMVMQRMRALTPGSLPTLRQASFCGEALRWPLVRAFQVAAPNATITNRYGPTEATIAITEHVIPDSDAHHDGVVPIGRPFCDGRVRIEEEELWLGGPQIAHGYVNDPAATAKAFVQDELTGERWYRTGDRVSMNKEGALLFLGRIDHQVKILGHRVEPEEVDAVVHHHLPAVNTVTLPVEVSGVTRLVTFIDRSVDEIALLQHCKEFLPTHMIPERIIALQDWPVNKHGKVDRMKLIELAYNEQGGIR